MMNSLNRHVLLQHARTRMFYVRNGDWTTDPSQARDFATTQAALVYSRALGMPEAEPVHFLPYDVSAPTCAAA